MKKLHFRTNSRHIGQLGRELVTDFVTALVELVKNAYDADAGSVMIRIENANTPNSRIVIADTGSGMTQQEFENRWMVIGTGNKVSEPYTPKGRKRAGKKGIGRFSVERLAERITLYSYTSTDHFKAMVNWNCYEEISLTGLRQRIDILRKKRDVMAAKYIVNQLEYYLLLKLKGDQKKEQTTVREKVGDAVKNYELCFNLDFLNMLEQDVFPILKKQESVELKLEEIDNVLEDIGNPEQESTYQILCDLKQREVLRKKDREADEEEGKTTGLVMVLDNLRDNWRQKDIDKLQKELRLLVAPEFIERDPFYVELQANQFSIPEDISVNSILNLSYAKIDAKIYDHGLASEIIYRDVSGKEERQIEHYQEPLLCGDLTFELYYFLRDSVHMSDESYNYRLGIEVLNLYCGVKIYRDNFRVKPYGDVGNDWLGLDNKKISDTHGYRVGNNQTVGVIRISDEGNPLLCDATNREGIIENEAYEQLREFAIKCIKTISRIRQEELEKAQTELDRAKKAQATQKKKESQHQKQQQLRYTKLLELVHSKEEPEKVVHALNNYISIENNFQREKEKSYEKTESAYQKMVYFQETELSMYKNLATLGILTGNFGHETQDIIARIDGTLAYYRELAPFVENAYFKTITENITLDFQRISGYSAMIIEFLAKKNRTVEEHLDFSTVLSGICSLYAGMLQAFGIQFTWKSEDDITMRMRRIDLESIIINMITNAFEQVKGKKPGIVSISFEKRDDDIELFFEDNGPGVPVENREKIFKALFTTKEEYGVGLGLNIVRDFVKEYKGTVYVTESKKYGGAKFVVHFKNKETGASEWNKN